MTGELSDQRTSNGTEDIVKHQMIGSAVGLLLMAFGVACAPAAGTEEDPATVRAAIEETNARFTEAFNQGDTAATAALYTEDAIVLPPGQGMVRGQPAIQEFNALDIETNALNGLVLTTSDVQVGGNLAVEVGTYSIQAGAMQDEGKYVVVWEKQEDGSWKLHRDIWNSNLMPAEEEEPGGEASGQ